MLIAQQAKESMTLFIEYGNKSDEIDMFDEDAFPPPFKQARLSETKFTCGQPAESKAHSTPDIRAAAAGLHASFLAIRNEEVQVQS